MQKYAYIYRSKITTAPVAMPQPPELWPDIHEAFSAEQRVYLSFFVKLIVPTASEGPPCTLPHGRFVRWWLYGFLERLLGDLESTRKGWWCMRPTAPCAARQSSPRRYAQRARSLPTGI